MSKDKKMALAAAEERRITTGEVRFEKREGQEGGGSISGYAAMFNRETQIGSGPWGFIEVIEPGAFDDVLQDDVRALFNHDPNMVLARTKAGTLKLSSDNTGLRYEYETPNVSYAKDLEENIRLGNVSQSSFAFVVGEERWVWNEEDPSKDKRIISKFKSLRDVSPVTYPAYHDTTVSARSLELHEEARGANLKPMRTADDFDREIRMRQALMNF